MMPETPLVIGVQEFRAELAKLVLVAQHRPIVLKKHGIEACVLLSYEAYEKLMKKAGK